MISPAAAELIRRSGAQIRKGIECVQAGDYVLAKVWLRAGLATLDALHALLDEPAQKPLRRLVVVGPREEGAELPPWMNRKVGDPDGDAA